MPRRVIDRIRDAIRTDNYDMTHHAIEEMAEDNLGIYDIESAILTGQIKRIEEEDPRGTKYVTEGMGIDKSKLIGVVGRFRETGIYLIITVYEIV
jgi:hypothetical protein